MPLAGDPRPPKLEHHSRNRGTAPADLGPRVRFTRGDGRAICPNMTAKSIVRIGDPVLRRVAASVADPARSEEHTSELQSLMRISYAVFCLKKKTITKRHHKKRT